MCRQRVFCICGYKWEDAPQTDLGEMIIYQSDDGVKLDVRLENKTVWLNQDQIASLFNKSKSTIVEHIANIFKEGELDEKVVCRKFRQTTQYDALEILIIHLTHGEVWQVCHSKAQDYQVLF